MICMDNPWLQNWSHELLQTVHHLLHSCVLRRVAFGLKQNTSPAPQLRDDAANEIRFTENFMRRRNCITIFLRWLTTVSGCILAVPARSWDVFVSLQTAQFGSVGQCVKHCVCQLAWLCLVSWTSLCDRRKIGWLFVGAHPYIIKCFLCCRCSTTIMWVGRGGRDASTFRRGTREKLFKSWVCDLKVDL